MLTMGMTGARGVVDAPGVVFGVAELGFESDGLGVFVAVGAVDGWS